MIRAVLFDLDGVLVDTGGVHYDALNNALIDNHCPTIDAKQHRELYNGLPTAVKLQMLVDRGLVGHDKVRDVAQSKRQWTTRLLESHVKFDPELYCLFAGLYSRGKKVAVVSNAVKDTVFSVCNILALTDCTSLLLSNEDGPPKPAPDLYQLACKCLDIQPHEALAIEDGQYGIESAEKAGCLVMAVRNRGDVTPTNVWRAMCSQS